MSERGFLPQLGAKLIDAGYRIIPIQPGDKLPVEPAWTKIEADKRTLKAWLDPDRQHPTTGRLVHYARAGVGILTERTPAVDIDLSHKALAQAVEDFAISAIGDFAPIRVGRAPKRLLLCRTDAPFRKVNSKVFLDPAGKRQAVEILGAGQQFVAFAIHPDTEKPYTWTEGFSPLEVDADALPLLTEEMAFAIRDFANELMESQPGWVIKTKNRDIRTALQVVDRDNSFAEDARKTEISDEDLHRKLLLVPDPHDYDNWLNIGMALYHQFDGGEKGLEWWHQWSENAVNYDAAALDAKWPTFDNAGKGRAPMTARLIIKLADEEATKLREVVFKDLKIKLSAASDVDMFRTVCDMIKHTEFDKLERSQLIGMVQKAWKRITDAVMPLSQARDLCRFENPTMPQPPKWLDGFCYVVMDETFYDTRSKSTFTRASFNDVHSKWMLTKADILEGRSTPEHTPSQVALNLYQIPVVKNRQYWPGEDLYFRMNGADLVNTYDDSNVPMVPDKLTAKDHANIAVVVDHFAHLFASERDRNIFIAWIAYIVQSGKRINWAIVLQGTEGDGKSWFNLLLAALLGFENVRTVAAQALQEQFTPWAENSQISFFEEVKLHGHNRFDILNRLKAHITNDVVTVRRMRVDGYEVMNTTSVIVTTNFKDALPLGEGDTRYFPLFSRFQTKAQIDAFKAAHPDYYKNLFAAVEESAGAIRKWFLEFDIPADFAPKARAPESVARREMVSLSKSDESSALDELLAERQSRGDMCETLLNATDLVDVINGYGAVIPQTQALNRMLLDKGFTRLGKVRTGDHMSLFWSQTPELFRTVIGSLDSTKIKQWMTDWL